MVPCIVEFVARMAQLVNNNGNLTRKRVATLITTLDRKGVAACRKRGEVSEASKATLSSRTLVVINQLSEGENPGVYVEGVVVTTLKCEASAPQGLVVVDKAGTFFSASVYNVAESAIRPGDVVTTWDPTLRNVTLKTGGKEWAYICVRIDEPQMMLQNGRTMDPTLRTPAVVSTELRTQ
mmetsp:Transcript_12221/g.28692  ORF Transcript_12221/g.28692 Transcript_12221/m.28692 type:complete len:180 (+) Transcript_12221:88-627(+)